MKADSSYDVVPYPSAAFPASHPDRLAVLATLFGLSPAPADRCRVLELGCAAGGNLIPLAVALPNSRFVGIDQSPRQIADGTAVIAKLALKNIELHAADILDVDDSCGTFDYVICHGVYSWVPRPVQDKILALCCRHLQPDGVGYISYNTLPGWHMQGMVRDMMCYHIGRCGSGAPASQVTHARALLNFLARSVTDQRKPYSLLLQGTLERLQGMSDAYLFHEYLEDCNEPLYFHEFCRRLEQHQLRYLGEAYLGDMGTFRFPDEVRQVLNSLATDQVQMEQYLDFLLNRTFRRTLVCHQQHQPRDALRPELLGSLHVACGLKPRSATPELASQSLEVFVGPNQTTLETGEPIFKAALCFLGESWPRTVAFDELLAGARDRLGRDPASRERDRLALGTALLRVVTYSNWMIELWQTPPRFVTTPGDRPLASPLVRWQAPRQATVTNLRHEVVPVADLDRRALPLLDGTRDRQAIVAGLLEQQADRTGIDAATAADTQDRQRLTAVVGDRLHYFAHAALLRA